MFKKIITAVVPVRKGSQRVLSKNTRKFADTTLLDLKLQVLKKVKNIDRIIVNTDCEISMEIAKKYNVEIYKREEYFASSNVTNDVHWKHIAEVTDTDILLMAQTTSPLIKVSTYEKAINDYISSLDLFDSINSVSKEKKFLWLDGRPLNYNIDKTPKSQDLPEIVSLNFAITIIDKSLMYHNGNVVGEHPKFLLLDKIESVDIDDMIDFEFAEFLYKKLGYDWLIK
ncbi:cytidylyltransferase domain-containing protein [Aliarcobacter butzleri]|uniref:acylneuraminate cytidylyltransferase family protein n=1 Tax=Aliarcobacter butzleri TaxID=28197 RepID=UPI00126004BE|nr:cytidylyltransferase [Aliarcobacter butzleri]MDK2047649.1 hypothetical protein [Aliarcobacter butzleri]